MTEHMNTEQLPVKPFHDELPLWSSPFGLQILEQMPLIRSGKLLDIGSGTGFLSIELAQRLGPEVEVTALDVWQSALEKVSLKAQHYNLSNIKAVRGSAENLPYGDGHFDMVISCNGLNNAGNFTKALAEAARVVKTGGYLIVSQNHRGTFELFYNLLIETLIENNRYELVNAVQQHIRKKRKTTLILNRDFQKLGFIIFGAKNADLSYRFNNATAFYNHHFIRESFYASWVEMLGKYADKLLGDVQKKLDKIAKSEGELRFDVPYSTIIGRKAPGVE